MPFDATFKIAVDSGPRVPWAKDEKGPSRLFPPQASVMVGGAFVPMARLTRTSVKGFGTTYAAAQATALLIPAEQCPATFCGLKAHRRQVLGPACPQIRPVRAATVSADRHTTEVLYRARRGQNFCSKPVKHTSTLSLTDNNDIILYSVETHNGSLQKESWVFVMGSHLHKTP